MALRFLDSFDHYAAADATMKWTSASYQSRGTGLHGYAMKGNFYKGMNFPGNVIIMEAFIKRINIPSTIFSLADNNSRAQLSCDWNANGAIEVQQYAGPRLFQSEPDLIRVDTWYHVSWRAFLDAVGSVEVRLNGATICNLTGVRTVSGLGDDPAFWSGLLGQFGLGDNGNACWFDDLVVMDDVEDGISDSRLPGGGGFDKFLGPVEIKVKRPSGAGLLAEWVPSAGANYQNVDDVDPDADTTVNSAAPTAVGASDLFAMEDLAADEDVVAVQSLVLARKTEEGIAAAAVLVNDGGSTTVGATVYQPNSYSYMHRPEPTRPGGGLWTKAAWDAIQYGYRRIV